MHLLQFRKTGFGTQFVAGKPPRLEPPAQDGSHIVVPALSGIEIQPQTRVGFPVSFAARVFVDLLKECLRRPHELVGIEGRQGKGETADAAIFTGIVGGCVHGVHDRA
jgi:hypothetical protein